MANCNKLFQDFNKKITPSQEQMQKMKKSREALEIKISDKMQEKLGMTVSYFTQGSGAQRMKTIIIKSDGTYDADRGVYLPQKPDISAETVQKYVFEAVKDHTDDGAEHRKKCVRVFYKCAYNIDFPTYYEVPGESYSYLAIKGDGWIKDDPEKMIEWFENLKDEDGQLIRLAKYLKAWASEKAYKMPSGIALTVWAAKYFVASKDRDDEALSSTLKAINNALLFGVSSTSPVEPYDDLVSKLDSDQKSLFKKALNEFCEDAQKALDNKNQLDASKLWQKHLGIRFPLGADENVDEKARVLMASAAAIVNGKVKLDSNGKINEGIGVNHKPHRNYGG